MSKRESLKTEILIERLPNGALQYKWFGNLSFAEITWVLDDMKLKMHLDGKQEAGSIPGLTPRRVP